MTHPGRPAPLAIDALPHIADGVPRALLMRALAATSEISLITDAAQNILHASRSFTTSPPSMISIGRPPGAISSLSTLMPSWW